MKKILLIAYHFHPDAAVGALRTIKYAKYLPKFGWQPHVLTTQPRYYRNLDYRTGKWPLPDDLYKRLSSMFSRESDNRSTKREQIRTSDPNAAEKTADMPAWKKFLHSLSITPDVNAGWFPPAAWKAVRLIRQHRYDIIYTSGPPQTCHLVGLAASKLTGVPWVLDFRDPWHEPQRKHPFAQAWWTNFQERYEARSVRQAHRVITTTDEWRDALIERHHPDLDDKCLSIVNGFDEEDFREIADTPRERASKRITFLHAGTLYYGRDPYALLTAAGELQQEGAIGAEEAALVFRGILDVDRDRIDSITTKYGMHSSVSIKPPVPRTDYIDLLLNSDILILFQGSAASVHIPAKAFEYLASGKQILVLTDKGATRNFMLQFEQVSIARINDKDDIKRALMECYERARSGYRVSTTDPRMKAITKLRLTEKFAGVLDSISSDLSPQSTRASAAGK
jgi:hypothetical protein